MGNAITKGHIIGKSKNRLGYANIPIKITNENPIRNWSLIEGIYILSISVISSYSLG
tara:strand:- start:227 stop:397 length:171 start_codon:yes stop_codon:yes gene_type:complete